MAAETFFKRADNQPAFSVETPIRAFEPTRPYPQNPSAIIYRVRFMQLRAYYQRPTANTPHPNLPQVYFADDTDFQDRMAGMIEWTRIYSTLPASWTDYESYAYNFPGFVFGTGPLNRQPITKTVTAKLTEDYFLIGALPNYSTNVANGDDLANGSWVAVAMTQTANAAAIPAAAGSSVVAAKLTPTAVPGTHSVSQASSIATVGSKVADVFVKGAGYTRAELQIDDGGAGFANVTVDLDTGLIQSGNYANAAVAAIGEGWWRINLGVTTSNASAAMKLLVLSPNSSSYTGDGSSGIYAWRAQMTPGATYPHATIAPVLTADGVNYPINTAGEIPTKFGQQYLYSWTNVVTAYLATTSNPTYNAYQALVATDQSNANANRYSIEATDSTLNLWTGSVWNRERRFVKAR